MSIFICQFCGRKTESKKGNSYHQSYCIDNPSPKRQKTKSEKWVKSMNKRKGKGTNQYTKAKELGLEPPPITEETRIKFSQAAKIHNSNRIEEVNEKISFSMKIAHQENRAGKLDPIKKYKKFNKPCRLYVIRAIYNGQHLIKIGITEKQISRRFRGVFKEYEILFELYLENGLFIARLEKYLLTYFIKNNKRISVGTFAGHTECFKTDIYSDIPIKISEFLFTNYNEF